MSITDGDLVVQVRAIWADVLGADSVESVSVDENFLEAGGNSMLLVMLWEELQPLANRPVRLSELFQHGTVRAQAQLLAPEPAPEPAFETDRRSLLSQRRSATAPAAGQGAANGGGA
jgi:aryl carrier-like protein